MNSASSMLDLESCSEEEIDAIREEFAKIREKLALREKTPGGKELVNPG